MIDVKHHGEDLFILKKLGAFAATADQDNFSAPWAGFIKAVYAVFGVMGTDGTGSPTQNARVDLLVNGTSIFSGTTKIDWSHALQLGTAHTPIGADTFGALTTNPTPVNKGDKIQIDGSQILNGTNPTQPTDLTVYVVITRQERSAPAAMLTGKVDPND